MGKDLNGKELGKGLMQKPNGTYIGRFTDRFGKRVEVRGKKLSEVKKLLIKEQYENDQRLNMRETDMTLDEWYEKWLSIYKYKVIKENTKAGYISFYKKHISPVLGGWKLAEITHIQVKELINNMDKAGYGYEMKNKAKIMLLDMFNKAMLDELVRRNPARGISIVRDEKKEPRVMTKEEQSVFFDCCKGTFYDNLFVLCVNTGLRPGEACALKRSDIDFEQKKLSVNSTLIYQKWEGDQKKTIHIDTPKTKTSFRTIPLNSTAELALKKQVMQKDAIQDKSGAKHCLDEFKDLLFVTKINTPIIEQTYVDAIDKIVDEINSTRNVIDEFERITPHCFRHTFATRCFEAGMKPKALQKILGHATLQMTMDLYAHVLPQLQEEEMLMLDEEMKKVDGMGDEAFLERWEKSEAGKGKIIKMIG